MKYGKRGMIAMAAAAMFAGAAGAAVTITGWNTPTLSGMNGTPFGDIPQYSNEIVIDGGTSNSFITGTARWTSNNTYVLKGPCYVTDGAVLYIQEGTVVRGYPWTDPAVTKPGALMVAKGGKVYARGTKANPIIFTDMWDNNVPGMTAGKMSANSGGAGYDMDPPNGGMTVDRDYSVWQPTFGYWGGVVLCGKCPVALSQTNVVAWPGMYVEGLPSSTYTQYGNGPLDDDDSSGAMTYCSIRYGGYPMTGTKEMNGLSMYAVGRGTEIHHIEVINSIDDGYEWFGGTVNTKYLVAYNFGDDGFDSDEGYRGKAQFLFGVQGAVHDIVNDETGSSGSPNSGYHSVVGSAWSDKGMEIDGAGGDEKGLPLALSQWYNMTIIGKGPTNGLAIVGNETTDETSDQCSANTAILCRDNSGPQIYNSIFMDFRGSGVVIEKRKDKNRGGYDYDCDARCGTNYNAWPPNTNTVFPNWAVYTTQTEGKQLEIKNCLFYNLGGSMFPTVKAAVELAGGMENSGTDDLKKHLDMKSGDLTNDLASVAYGNSLAASMPIQSLTRLISANDDLTAKRVYPITSINPCAANDAVSSPRTPPADGFYSPVNYKGAFGPDHNWMEGWTLTAKLGLAVTNMNTEGSVISDIGPYPSAKFSTEAGAKYRIETATTLTPADWTTVGYVLGDGAEKWYADDSGASRKFIRVVRE